MTPIEKQAEGLMDSVQKYFTDTKSFMPAYTGAAIGAGALGLASAGRREGENPRQRALRILRNAAAGGLLGGVGSQALVQGGGGAIESFVNPNANKGDKNKPDFGRSPLGRPMVAALPFLLGHGANAKMRDRSLAKLLPASGLGNIVDPATNTTLYSFPELKGKQMMIPENRKWLARETDKVFRQQRAMAPKAQAQMFAEIEKHLGRTPGVGAGDPNLLNFLKGSYSRNGARTIFNTGSALRGVNFLSRGAQQRWARGTGALGSAAGLAYLLGYPEINARLSPSSKGTDGLSIPAAAGKTVVDTAGNLAKGYLTDPLPKGTVDPTLHEDSLWKTLTTGL